MKTVLAIAAILSLSFLVACSSSSGGGTAPPTGGFSNSNLSGTYAFSTVGTDINGCIITIAGTFAANGKGSISSGAIDVVEPCFSTTGLLLQGVSVTGGGYNVGADGRPANSGGTITLTTASNGSFIFNYVLSSSNGGLITYYSTNAGDGGSGSGSFQLQTSVTQTSINGQAYAFNVTGLSDSAEAPFAIAGAFALDSNGDVGVSTAGVEDVNSDNDAVCGPSGCGISSGFIDLSTTPGTASFSSTAGTFTFDVYPVTPSQLIFIETDGTFITAGNAFTQSSSFPSGNNIFSVAGFDASAGLPITAVGILASNGSGGITNASTEDVNDAGTYTEVTGYTGSYTTPSTGRSIVTLSGFINEGSLGCSDCQFAAYPSTGGVMLLEIDDAGITDGIAYAQGSSPTFASGQGYGVDITGTNTSSSGSAVEEDDIAEFTYSSSNCATNANLCGLIDFNDEGSTSFGNSYDGAYAADTTGIPGRGTIASEGNNTYDMATYVVNPSTSVCIVADSTMIALCTIQTQSATSAESANVAQRHMVAIRAAIAAKKHAKQRKSN